MRVIGISGVWCYWRDVNPVWQNLSSALQKALPVTEMVIAEEPGCWPMQSGRLCGFRDRIVRANDDGKDILLVGHSMGGIVACAAAKRFRRSKVLGIITIYSPHSMPLYDFTGQLDARGPLPAEVISFGATHDWLVPLGAAAHPLAKKHVTLWSDHQDDLVRNPALAERIATKAKEQLFPQT